MKTKYFKKIFAGSVQSVAKITSDYEVEINNSEIYSYTMDLKENLTPAINRLDGRGFIPCEETEYKEFANKTLTYLKSII